MDKLRKYLPFLAIYLLTTGISFATLSFAADRNQSTVSPVQEDDLQPGGIGMYFSGPKDQACPINGEMFTSEQKDIWEERRPLTVMVENHLDARPLSGISRADVVYEAVAEGGITRLMGVYYCRATEPADPKYDVGPVRSARSYFVDLASEYSEYPLYAHVGGANCSAPEGGACTTNIKVRALEQIADYGWLKNGNDLNQFNLGYNVCRREPSRTGVEKAYEHTVYCSTEALWETAEQRGLEGWDEEYFTSWQFKDGTTKSDRGDVNEISFDFWEGYSDYRVRWSYDKESNLYSRANGGKDDVDHMTGEVIKASVVAVQFAVEEGPLDEHKHMFYELVDDGKALIFQDGEVISGTWEKDDRTERTIFYDKSGKEIKFNRGQIWIEVLPSGNKVDYES